MQEAGGIGGREAEVRVERKELREKREELRGEGGVSVEVLEEGREGQRRRVGDSKILELPDIVQLVLP